MTENLDLIYHLDHELRNWSSRNLALPLAIQTASPGTYKLNWTCISYYDDFTTPFQIEHCMVQSKRLDSFEHTQIWASMIAGFLRVSSQIFAFFLTGFTKLTTSMQPFSLLSQLKIQYIAILGLAKMPILSHSSAHTTSCRRLQPLSIIALDNK